MADDAITVVLADDHAIVRTGLRLLLTQAGMEVVAETGDVDTAVRYVLGHKPDVLVLDLSMPGRSSLPALPRFLEASPDTRIVVLTMHEEPRFAREALGSGAAASFSRRPPTTSWCRPSMRRARDARASTPRWAPGSRPRPWARPAGSASARPASCA